MNLGFIKLYLYKHYKSQLCLPRLLKFRFCRLSSFPRQIFFVKVSIAWMQDRSLILAGVCGWGNLIPKLYCWQTDSIGPMIATPCHFWESLTELWAKIKKHLEIHWKTTKDTLFLIWLMKIKVVPLSEALPTNFFKAALMRRAWLPTTRPKNI